MMNLTESLTNVPLEVHQPVLAQHAAETETESVTEAKTDTSTYVLIDTYPSPGSYAYFSKGTDQNKSDETDQPYSIAQFQANSDLLEGYRELFGQFNVKAADAANHEADPTVIPEVYGVFVKEAVLFAPVSETDQIDTP